MKTLRAPLQPPSTPKSFTHRLEVDVSKNVGLVVILHLIILDRSLIFLMLVLEFPLAGLGLLGLVGDVANCPAPAPVF
jgi:hypothetical protein